MTSTWSRNFAIAVIGAVTLVGYQNCGQATHKGGTADLASLQSLNACEKPLAVAFQSTYYPFLRQQTACISCHSSGPGSGFFASGDPVASLKAFMGKGFQKISDRAVSDHKAGYTGPQHTAAIASLKAAWMPREAAYADCLANAGGAPIVPGAPVPTKYTVGKTANPVANNQTVVLNWNLATDFVDPANAFAGATFSITVRTLNVAGGIPAYQFENPRLVNNTGYAAQVSGINIYVDDVLVDGETFLYVERYVPATANDNTRRISQGSQGQAYLARAVDRPIQVKVAFVKAGRADIDFRPVTYQQLTGAGGIFTTNCQSCHGNSGGLSLAANNLQALVGRRSNSGATLVSPYNLEDNLIYERMNDNGAPMPRNGLLPKDQIDRVRDWILDGAPLNAAAIAR